MDMRVPNVSPITVTFTNKLKLDPKDFKPLKEVLLTKPIGEEAAKTDAWWHEGYREAKEIEAAIRDGKYKYEKPEIYREDGSLNFDYFRSPDDDGMI